MASSTEDKIQRILACPCCKSSDLMTHEQTKITCMGCGACYDVFKNKPVLIPQASPVFKWYKPRKESVPSRKRGFVVNLKKFYRRLRPPDRVWTVQSQRVLQRILEDKKPDAPGSAVVLVGSGADSVYKRILSSYREIIRVGLAHRGDVDFFCDLCALPIGDNTVDLIFSSSVLEHVYDPEQAVREMYRVVKPGGHVYAEIPFIRGFHMSPVDYQRYTITGIEELFARHGFSLDKKGVCSGPFTAVALHIIDFWKGVFSFNRYLRLVVVSLLRLLLHPFKYFDRLCESSSWAKVTACNFYYLGFKGDFDPR
jgi:SAM-dependent methyltransferase/uncharacterized protein YbaR (Trm112 family)